MKKNSTLRRLENPEFPKWENPETGFGFVLGILFWILMFLGFLFLAYVHLFSFNLRYILHLVYPKNYNIPFWFSVLITLFLFPGTLIIILLGTFIRIVRD